MSSNAHQQPRTFVDPRRTVEVARVVERAKHRVTCSCGRSRHPDVACAWCGRAPEGQSNG